MRAAEYLAALLRRDSEVGLLAVNQPQVVQFSNY